MYDNLDVIFLGGLFPKETESEIIKNSIGSIQNAANNFQWELVKGLEANLSNNIKIINSIFVGSYPKRFKKINIKTYNFSHLESGSNDINVGYCNLTIIKHFHRYISLRAHIKNWIQDDSEKQKVVIAYAMTTPFTKILKYIKTLDENIITCIIIPDLPQYMNMSGRENTIYKFMKKIEIKQMDKDIAHADCFVFLTKYMSDFLNNNKPSTVVEGIATDVFSGVDKIMKNPNIKTILYSGGLEEKYGVVNLIKAFEKIVGENFRLVICGSGTAEKEIINASKRDNRIIFKGLVTREKVLELQKTANVLINPRPNKEEYTKYSFPSKIMEYLSSGVPVISYKLDGIPDEYYDYMYTIEDLENKDSLYDTINKVMSKPNQELVDFGEKAKCFALNYKNNRIQVGKILEMINDQKVGMRK